LGNKTLISVAGFRKLIRIMRTQTHESPYVAALKVVGTLAAALYLGTKITKTVKAIRGEECPDCDEIIEALDTVYSFCPRCKRFFPL
jgi:hypothetical protein